MQHSIKIVQVQSDRGELYRGHFPEWAANHRPNPIIQIRSPADVQDFNGVVERPQGIVRARAAAMLVHSKLPMSFYTCALQYASAIWNATIHTDCSKTPHELVFGNRDDVRRLQPFGCLVFVQIPKEARSKRGVPKLHKALPGVFLGYTGETIIKVYFFNTRTVREEYHVRFCPRRFPGLHLRSEHLSLDLESEPLNVDSISGDEPHDDTPDRLAKRNQRA